MRNKSAFIFLLACLALFLSVSCLAYGRRSGVSVAEVLAAVNQVRQQNGLEPLRVDDRLMAAATEKTRDMERLKYFNHENPLGLTPWYWIKKNHYTYLFAGENLAINYSDKNALLAAWLNSSSHKQNLLNPNFRDTGISVEKTNVDGKEYVFIVQLFGAPATISMK